MSATATAPQRPAARLGRWTSALLVATGLASAVFTIGTALQAFLIVNEETLRRMMVLAGTAPESAVEQAPGFLTGFRIVGCLYLAGNAVGVLALRRRPYRWLFWVVLVVNVTQAAGVVMVPPEMFTAARERFGIVGMAPSLVTDGGALVLAVALIAGSVATGAAWGQVKRHGCHAVGRAGEKH